MLKMLSSCNDEKTVIKATILNLQKKTKSILEILFLCILYWYVKFQKLALKATEI